MQHLRDLLNAKRLDAESILSQRLSVTLKIDGTAMQIVNGEDFYKRPDNPDCHKDGKELTMFDLALNNYYYLPYKHLYAMIQKRINLPGVMNFEVLSPKEYHTIQYKSKFDNDIVLISAYDEEHGNALSYSNLKDLAKKLNVSVVESLIDDDTFENNSVNIVKDILDNRNDEQKLYDTLKHKLLSNSISISDDEIEGLAISIPDDGTGKSRYYKLNNLEFMSSMMDNIDEQRSNWCDYSNMVKEFAKQAEGLVDDAIQNEDELFDRLMYICENIFASTESLERLCEAASMDKERISEEYMSLNLDFFKDYNSSIYNIIKEDHEAAELLFILLIVFKRTHDKECFCNLSTVKIANKIVKALE